MEKGGLRFRAVLAIVLAGSLALAGGAAAEDNGSVGIGSFLTDMLRGAEVGQGAAEDAGPDQSRRRVPFSESQIQLSFAPLVRETAPAVVNVYASAVVRQRSPFAGDPFFEQFFGRQMPPRVQKSLGSGVMVDSSGIVVTNYHVIKNADEVKVALSDGREFESNVLLKDESLDLAVLKIDGPGGFPSVRLGNSDALEVGDLVLAIGNPFGVGQTTTSGIVSALARSNVGISDFGFFIQTDAAINPGNSGGALVDMRGDVVGINTAIFSRSGGSNGIGFAIPADIVRPVVAAARSGADYFERPYIGAQFEPVTPQIAEALGMRRPGGALVSNIVEKSPAAKAGLEPGDVVLSVDGAKIQDPNALRYRIATEPIGKTVRMDILRKGGKHTVEVRLARAPAGSGSAALTIEGDNPFGGAKVAQLSPRLAQRLNMPVNIQGVVVVDVKHNSPAASVGLKPRDIVRDVNGRQIDDPGTLKAMAESGSSWWRFTIERNGRILRQMLRY